MFYDITNRPAESFPKNPGACSVPVLYLPDKTPGALPIADTSYLLLGLTGVGKSCLVRKLVQAFQNSQEDALFLFLDPKNEFAAAFQEEDDMVLSFRENSAGTAAFRWNLLEELRVAPNPEGVLTDFSEFLFRDMAREGKNILWLTAAREIFEAFIRTILYCYKNCPPNRQITDALKSMLPGQMVTHLNRYAPNRAIVKNFLGYQGEVLNRFRYSKLTQEYMAFLSAALRRFSGDSFNSATGCDTFAGFLKGKYGKMFLSFDYSDLASAKSFYSFVLHYLIAQKLGKDTNRSRKLYLILDEAGLLCTDFGLMAGALLGRGCGLRLVVTAQSVKLLHELAEDENEADAMLGGFPSTVAFRSDHVTASAIQKIFGKERRLQMVTPMSRYDRPVVNATLEPYVEEDAPFLGVGEAYVKIEGAKPAKVYFPLE